MVLPMKMINYFGITIFIIFSLMISCVNAQDVDVNRYNAISDTLLVINGDTIVSSRVLISKKDIIELDTIRLNKEGLIVASFTMTATTLGHSVEVSTDKPFFSAEMKKEILNNQSNYKYIYIKNINLQTEDGLVVKPTLSVIKIIFSN